MIEIARQIRAEVTHSAPLLRLTAAEAAGAEPAPEHWSRKQILGHLIDSAANNHQRIVRARYAAATDFPPYEQNAWVKLQHYQDANWQELVDFWAAYNLHLARIVERLAPEELAAECHVGRPSLVTLEFVVVDYLRHLRHHLAQLV